MQAPEMSHLPLSNSDSLLTALFIAAVVHVLILLGINFRTPQPAKVSKSIEITLSHAALKKAPKQAKFLAPDHQLGAGDDTSKPEPLNEKAPSPALEAVTPAKKPGPASIVEPKKPVTPKIAVQPQAPVKVAEPVEQPEQNEVAEEKPKLSAEALQQQIAQLGERIRSSQQSSQDTKIKFVNSISTHKYLAAQYVKDWEDKV